MTRRTLPLRWSHTLAALAIFATACADEAPVGLLAPETDALLAAGPPAGFPVVIVRQGGGPPSGSAAPVVDNLADAVAKVRADGTIRVFPGTYVTDGVVVDKPMTIEAATETRPLIQNPGSFGSFVVNGVQSGTVAFRDLDFDVRGSTAIAAIAYDQVVVDGCGFDIAGTAGVYAVASPVSGASVQVQSSSFGGGSMGTFAAGAKDFHVLNSSFADHSFSGVQYQGGASGRAEGNTAERCGPRGCIRIIGPDGVHVVGNRVSNEVGRNVSAGIQAADFGAPFETRVVIEDNDVVGTGGDAFGNGIQVGGVDHAVVVENRVGGARNGIEIWSVREGSIDRNTVDPCGDWNCIGIGGGGEDVAVRDNVLRSVLERPAFFGILAHWPAGSGRLAITGNEITGVGDPLDPNDPTTYPLEIGFQAGGWNPGVLDAPRGEAVIFSDNRVTNAGAGVRAFHGGVIEGLDNTFETVFGEVLGAHDLGILRLHSSDITDYRYPMAISGLEHEGVVYPGREGTLDVTCNWWGSASGPHDVPSNIPTSAYTPWATQPVAGTSTTTCSGGA